jgi:hypothetical protein
VKITFTFWVWRQAKLAASRVRVVGADKFVQPPVFPQNCWNNALCAEAAACADGQDYPPSRFGRRKTPLFSEAD